MVEILLESEANNPNISGVSYRAGTITLTGAQFAAWSNITNPQAACQLLSSGGIPAQITTDAGPITDCTTSVGTTVTSITMGHIWVAVTIAGTGGCSPCLFDPAYKPYTWKPGINLATAMNFTPGDPLAQAIDAYQYGNVTSGVYTIPYIRQLNSTGELTTLLQGYASSYLSYLQAHHLQGAQIEDIVSGGVISPENTTTPSSTLPYPSAQAHEWDCTAPASCGPHDQYRTKLTVNVTRANPDGSGTQTLFAVSGAPPVFFVDQIYGRRPHDRYELQHHRHQDHQRLRHIQGLSQARRCCAFDVYGRAIPGAAAELPSACDRRADSRPSVCRLGERRIAGRQLYGCDSIQARSVGDADLHCAGVGGHVQHAVQQMVERSSR
ncbi:MAG: hypothetical protein WDM89_22255 [Rhizomicrobium sp.]